MTSPPNPNPLPAYLASYTTPSHASQYGTPASHAQAPQLSPQQQQQQQQQMMALHYAFPQGIPSSIAALPPLQRENIIRHATTQYQQAMAAQQGTPRVQQPQQQQQQQQQHGAAQQQVQLAHQMAMSHLLAARQQQQQQQQRPSLSQQPSHAPSMSPTHDPRSRPATGTPAQPVQSGAQPAMLREQFAQLQAAHAGVGGGVGVPPGGMMGIGVGGVGGMGGLMSSSAFRPNSGPQSQPTPQVPQQQWAASSAQGPAMPAIPPQGLPPGMSSMAMFNPAAAAVALQAQQQAQAMQQHQQAALHQHQQQQQAQQQQNLQQAQSQFAGMPAQAYGMLAAQGMQGLRPPGVPGSAPRPARGPIGPSGPPQTPTHPSAAAAHPGSLPRPTRPTGPPQNPHERISVLPAVPSVPDSDPPEPDYTYGGLLPALSKSEIFHLKDWMERDDAWAALLRTPEKVAREREERASIGEGKRWWVREARDQAVGAGMEVVWPGEKRRRDLARERERQARESAQQGYAQGRGTRNTMAAAAAAASSSTSGVGGVLVRKEYKPTKGELREVGKRGEVLVPVRLEIEHEHWRLRDTFVWDVNDTVMTPDLFAQTICEDFHLPARDFVPLIAESVRKQVSESTGFEFADSGAGGAVGLVDLTAEEGVVGMEVDGAEGRGRLGEREKGWWEGWRKRVRLGVVRGRGKGKEREWAGSAGVVPDADAEREGRRKRGKGIGEDDVEEGMDVDELERTIRWQGADEELRVIIKLDITYGTMNLTDQFEWDISSSTVTPEQWAEVYAAELGLAPEFKTAIAHDIREQIQTFRKSLVISGHTFDGPVLDAELRPSFLPPVSPTSLTRSADEAMNYTPILTHLSEADIAREEQEREKEARRRRRATRGRRGVQQLPDREPLKTHRSIPLVGTMAPQQQAPAMPVLTSRRAAAAAATANISSIIAAEAKDQFPPPPALVGPTLKLAPKTRRGEDEANGNGTAPSSSAGGPAGAGGSGANAPPTTMQNNPHRQAHVTKKQLREKEREAKEMEYAETQKENMIDGVWHCSNCGCPESIAVGRRKGPLGEKTMCGVCGKFWHRYRRPREVAYNPSEEFHRGLKDKEESDRRGKKKKRPNAANNNASLNEEDTPEIEVLENMPAGERAEPGRGDEDEDDQSEEPATKPASAMSAKGETSKPKPPSPAFKDIPMDDSSDEEPIQQPVKKTPSKPSPSKRQSASGKTLPPGTAPTSSQAARNNSKTPSPNKSRPKAPTPPQWLIDAQASLLSKFPHDKFEIVQKSNANADPVAPAEWRIKCLDCPGKLYNTGPDDTLNNFTVHVKNRHHRAQVQKRMTGTSS